MNVTRLTNSNFTYQPMGTQQREFESSTLKIDQFVSTKKQQPQFSSIGHWGRTLLLGTFVTIAAALDAQISPEAIRKSYPMMTKMALWDHRNKPEAENNCPHFNNFPELQQDPRAAYYYFEAREKIGEDPFKNNGNLPDKLTFEKIEGIIKKNGLEINEDGYLVEQ